jgi:hypothetical protein
MHSLPVLRLDLVPRNDSVSHSSRNGTGVTVRSEYPDFGKDGLERTNPFVASFRCMNNQPSGQSFLETRLTFQCPLLPVALVLDISLEFHLLLVRKFYKDHPMRYLNRQKQRQQKRTGNDDVKCRLEIATFGLDKRQHFLSQRLELLKGSRVRHVKLESLGHLTANPS